MTTENIIEKTIYEMKVSDFVANLGSVFKQDINNINGGYPILSWQ